MTESADETLQQRFEAAMRAEEERKAAWDLGIPLDPRGAFDFEVALSNVDIILSAIATGEISPALGAAHVQPLLTRDWDDGRAGDLFCMWANLSDIECFTAPGSEGNRDIENAMRAAATEWEEVDRNDAEAVRAYCDLWIAKCDYTLWRDRMGGYTFESLDADGWFRWDSA